MNQVRHIIQGLNDHYTGTVAVAIGVLTLWQLLVALFGVDLCDSGYYLTFFENIFKHPQSVEYNFMYYLSGVAGGALSAILPEGGKWLTMRVAGVLCNTGAMVILACALRRILPATAIVLGFLMVTASLVAFPFTFNNDLMSGLLWVAAVAWAYKGLSGGKWLHLLLAGIVVGLNTFTRIPNMLAVGLAVMPFIAKIHIKRSWRDAWCQCGTFLLGAVAGTLAVIGMMMALGHWDIFKQNVTDLIGVATGSSGVATHNTGGLVAVILSFYKQCLLVGLKMAALWLPLWLAWRYIGNRWLRWAVWLAIAIAAIYFMWHQSHIMHPLWVMCVVGCVLVIRQGGARAIAAWLGLFMLMVFPLGSDGATNNGGIIAWMAAPVAALVWQRRYNVLFPLAFIGVGLLQTLTVGAYFDGGALWHKTVAVADARAVAIRTTPERARIINETLSGLSGQLSAGDTLLCYGSIPMMNHLTRTIPAICCSWPELLSADALSTRLDAEKSRPAILRQKFNNLGAYWSEANDDYLRAYPHEDKFLTQDKMDAINRFIDDNGYRIIWQNQWFALYKAD